MNLFTIMLQCCDLSNPKHFWRYNKENFTVDILYTKGENHFLGGMALKEYGLPMTQREHCGLGQEVIREST